MMKLALKPNQKGKTNTLTRQRPLPVLPKEIDPVESTDDNYEMPKRPDVLESNALRSQRPPVPLPSEGIYESADNDVSNWSRSQSTQYLDMNQGQAKLEEMNISEYVPMNSDVITNFNNSLNFQESTPEIPEKPKNFNQNSRRLPVDTRSAPEIPKKPRHLYPINPQESQLKNLTGPSTSLVRRPNVQGSVLEKPARLNGKPTVKPRHQATVDETNDYLQPKPAVHSNLESPERSRSPSQEATRNLRQDFRKFPPIPEPQPGISDSEDIYEAEPVVKPKPPVKNCIQSRPLPLIPNQHVPPTILPPKPNMLPSKENKLESEDFDMADFPPPPPEFFEVATMSNDPLVTESIRKGFDETDLPRPPILTTVDDAHVALLRDLLPEYDDTSSDDSSSNFNPNNCMYYRNTDRNGAKKLLQRVAQLESNTFVLRPSTKPSYFMGLTIFHDGYYYNLGIYRDINEKFYGQSLDERETVKFDKIEEFIVYYKYNPIPVKKRDGRVVELYLKHSLPDYIY